MGAGLYTKTTRATGTVLTANIYNEDHQNHIDNQNTEMTDDYSTNAIQMQSVVDPYPAQVISLPVSLAGELERLRYQFLQLLQAIKPSRTIWYDDLNIPFANRVARVAKTADYTVTTDDEIIECDATAAAITITLPASASAGAGKIYVIKKTDSSGNKVTIDADGSEPIDGQLTQVLAGQYQSICVESTGSAWVILYQYRITSLILQRAAKTANYILTENDEVIECDASGGAFSISLLPVAVTAIGKIVVIKKIDSSVNAVTIDPNGNETIDGWTIRKLERQYQTIILENTGSEWLSIAEYKTPLRLNYKEVTATYTALESDELIECNASAGGIVVYLPALANVEIGKLYIIRKIDTSNYTVTIDPDGSETIDESPSLIMGAQFNSYAIYKKSASMWGRLTSIGGVREADIDWQNAGGMIQQFGNDAGTEFSVTGTSYQTVILLIRIYIPEFATKVYLNARLKSSGAPATASLRFAVAGDYSSVVTTTSTAYVWTSEANLDVTALSGWVDLSIEIKSSGATQTAYLKQWGMRIA